MPTLSPGSSITLSLGKFSVVSVRGDFSFVESGDNDEGSYVSGARVFGPYGESVTLMLYAQSSVTYTQSMSQTFDPDVSYSLDTSGNVTGLVGPDGVEAFLARRYNSPMLNFSSLHGLTNTRQATGTGDSLAVDASVARLGTQTAKLTLPTNGTLWAEVGFPPMSKTMDNLRMGVLAYIADYTKIGNVTFYLAKESGYANFITCSYKIMDTGGNPNRYNGWHYLTFPNSGASTWTVGSGAVADGDVIAAGKIRVNPAGGTNGGTINLHSLHHNAKVQKPSILITADDGDASWFDIGIPYLNTKGLKSTHAVIGSLIGTGGYATLSQLQQAYASGHDFVVHGATNLTTLGTSALRISDVLANQQWLLANGFSRNYGWRHYVYPNGAYEMTAGDQEIINITKQCGMLSGRGTQKPTRVDHSVDLGDRWYTYNIMGGESSESTATLIAAVDACIAQGESGVLMFHKLVSGTPGAAIEYNIADFKAVMDYIAEKRNAGFIKVQTVPEWYASTRAYVDAAVQ